jgi:hypothetical protein
MRVILAAVACLVALVRADSVSAYAGSDGSRAVAPAICSEPARVLEVSLFVDVGDAVGGERVERAGGELNEEGGGTTLWCVSADDPRCSPLDTSGQHGVSFGTAKLSYTASDGIEGPKARDLAAVSGETTHRGSARDGFLGRLERPPNRRAA